MFLVVLAFLLGSLPAGLLVTRTRGIDLRRSGSGNIGATNVLRTAGKLPAVLTLLADLGKGALAVWVAKHYGTGIVWLGIIGAAAVAGHVFSIFLHFRGGKGVATAIGALLIYSPQTGLFTIIIWIMTVAISRYSSLGALVSLGLLPFSIALLDSPQKLPFAIIVLAIAGFKHKGNIKRLMSGTESKVGQK